MGILTNKWTPGPIDRLSNRPGEEKADQAKIEKYEKKVSKDSTKLDSAGDVLEKKVRATGIAAAGAHEVLDTLKQDIKEDRKKIHDEKKLCGRASREVKGLRKAAVDDLSRQEKRALKGLVNAPIFTEVPVQPPATGTQRVPWWTTTEGQQKVADARLSPLAVERWAQFTGSVVGFEQAREDVQAQIAELRNHRHLQKADAAKARSVVHAVDALEKATKNLAHDQKELRGWTKERKEDLDSLAASQERRSVNAKKEAAKVRKETEAKVKHLEADAVKHETNARKAREAAAEMATSPTPDK